MIAWVLRALLGERPPARPARWERVQDTYRWDCPCGARSRGSWWLPLDAQWAASQHYLRKPHGHPEPRIRDQHGKVVAGLPYDV